MCIRGRRIPHVRSHCTRDSTTSPRYRNFSWERSSAHLQDPFSPSQENLPNLWERHLRCHGLDVIPWLLSNGITLLFGSWMHRQLLRAEPGRAGPSRAEPGRCLRGGDDWSTSGTGRRQYNGFVQFLPAWNPFVWESSEFKAFKSASRRQRLGRPLFSS